ncbi:hypothetical protein D3C81_1826660 [compost metagenome]
MLTNTEYAGLKLHRGQPRKQVAEAGLRVVQVDPAARQIGHQKTAATLTNPSNNGFVKIGASGARPRHRVDPDSDGSTASQSD